MSEEEGKTYQITFEVEDLMKIAFLNDLDTMIELRKLALTKLLHDAVVDLTFKKKDGSDRRMVCTKNEQIRPVYEGTTDQHKTPNENQFRVWDLDKEEWRSFKLESLYPETITIVRFVE